MGAFKDLTGRRFGRLTVEERAGNRNGHATWLCRCECGNTKVITGASLTAGKTRSCGCLHQDVTREKNKDKTTHGGTHTRLYSIWRGMKKRCLLKTHKAYKNYGGRGITVCEEWMDFQKFEKWATENGYDDKLTLDRVDNNGGYGPNNCRWRTQKEQALNRRTNHYISYGGETKTISEWEETLGMRRGTIVSRLSMGWTTEQAIEGRR